MHLFFQNGAWWWLGFLVLVPLLVHLVARARPREIRYPSLQFLSEAVKKSARWKKPQDWLVWFLRTLLVAAIVLAILGPLLLWGGATPGGKSTMVVVIDRSASMGFEDRFSEAVEVATGVLRERKPDFANVIWIGAQPEGVFLEPGPAVDGLVETMSRVEVRPEPGASEMALELAMGQLADAEGTRELVVISDFQASAWREVRWPMVQGVKVTRLQVAEGDGRNRALTNLRVEPARPVAGQRASLVCEVRNFSAEAVRLPVYGNLDGARVSREAEVAAWGQAEVVFPLEFGDEGDKLLQVRLAEDGFPGDDFRGLGVKSRREFLLAVRGEAGVWGEVARALPWLGLSEDEGKADFVFVWGWSGEEAEQLRVLAEEGLTVMLAAERGLRGESLAALTGIASGGGIYEEESGDKGWRVRVGREEAEVFELFRDGRFGDPFRGVFRRRMNLPEQLGGEVWARYSDRIPALVVWQVGKGRVVLWNLGLDEETGDWTKQANFLPFVGEMLLATRPREELLRPGAVRAGVVASWRPGPEGGGGEMVLRGVEGIEAEVVRRKEGGEVVFESLEGLGPGVWRWEQGGREVDRFVVDFPSSESDLRVLKEGEGVELQESKGLARRMALARGWPVWSWVLLLGLPLMALEVWFSGLGIGAKGGAR
ncbi:MAG: BatA and WFA domain-containing protein [Verrucomicrobiota bacterium]